MSPSGPFQTSEAKVICFCGCNAIINTEGCKLRALVSLKNTIGYVLDGYWMVPLTRTGQLGNPRTFANTKSPLLNK